MTQTQTSTTQVRPPTLTQKQLEDQLRNLRGTEIVTLITKTIPSMNKTGNRFHGQVFKISRVNGILNFIYGNSVNLQRDREGIVEDFTPEPRKWGNRIQGTTFVEHKDVLYLEMKVERSLAHEYIWANGTQLTDAETNELKDWLKKSKQPSTQKTEKEIILRDYKLSSIIGIVMQGIQHIVIPTK